AEVVLDPRGGAGLAADGDAVEGDGEEALRGAVDGRRQACRAGTDDEEVADPVPRRLLAHPGRRSQLGVVRVAPHPVAPDHDRGFLGRDPEPLEERLGTGGPLRVDPAERQPVAGSEVAEATGVREAARADDLQPGAETAEQLSTQEEGAQYEVAERRIFADQAAQGLRGHLQSLPGLADDRRVEGRLPGQQAELAEEAAGAMDGDRGLVPL